MSIYLKIRKNFGTFKLNVEFEAKNEIMALLGASGCGKSITLKCIGGIIRPDEGLIVVDGVTLFDSRKKINISPQKRKVGLLFQNYALFPNMTVEENIRSVLALGEKTRIKERFHSLAEKFYISGLENHYPAQLSGGQQQRVAIARIMASDPTIIMLDEPLSALDSYLRWHLENELIDILADFDGTTLYVSHNRDEVYRICDRVCVINNGHSEGVRTRQELFEAPNTLASSLLSGCKNYSRATKLDEHRIRAEDWNVDLYCSAIVTDDIRYVGVRAHFVTICGQGEECTEFSREKNVIKGRVLRITEDVFSTIITLVPSETGSKHDFSRIRMELSKETARDIRLGEEIFTKIRPEDIMPLKK